MGPSCFWARHVDDTAGSEGGREAMKTIVTTHPYGCPEVAPLEYLKSMGIEPTLNSVGRKYSKDELKDTLIKECPDIIIAGTEKYNADVLDLIPNLKMISRVGIGLDSVDLDECVKRNITVTYTPDAPSNAVAELTLCQMLNMLRRVQVVSHCLKDGGWKRFIGRDIRDCNVGIIGVGRIGSLMIEKLQGMKPRRIFINDIVEERMHDRVRCESATKHQILRGCDIVTIHIPLNAENLGYISEKDFKLMKRDACIINMSRGGIINEEDLFAWLSNNPDASAAVDTYEEEPYKGSLVKLSNAYLTPHLGSCTRKSRFDMEMSAAEEVVNFTQNKRFNNQVV
ncbi:MAG: hypothetical protein GF334_12535 [Candidatus Altiarchaeales archaeon]|nr:hypothetical protein [Candidatus Altiarchaeales archaeon]